MYILCDTCSVLMLIRIAPDMFMDDRYECTTIQEVSRELFRTQKFKTKYLWRMKYKSKIKAMGESIAKGDSYNLCFSTIRNLVNVGIKNKRTGRFFNLSNVDQIIAACTIAHNFQLTTVDDDLKDFLIQEFSCNTISPLNMINEWMEKGLLQWSDYLQLIIEDWDKCNEHPQSIKAIKRFEKLSGYPYVGPK